MEEYKKKFIEFMVRSKVLTFGDFVTKSGRETPYFINTGNYETGLDLLLLGEYYGECISDNFKSSEYNVIFGPAYKGVALVLPVTMYLAPKRNSTLYYCFNRKEEKKHGDRKCLIGHVVRNGDNILITEDVTTSGETIRDSINLLTNFAKKNSFDRDGKITFAGVILSVNRMEVGQSSKKTAIQELSEELGVKVVSIVNIHEIVTYLRAHKIDEKEIINDELFVKINDYWSKYCPEMPQ